jgi:hypothetical protein
MDTSMTEERTSGLDLPIVLKSEIVLKGIEAIVRYNELREPTQEVRKILYHPEMKDFLNEEYRGSQKLFADWNSAMETNGLVMDARGPMVTAGIARAVHRGFARFLLAGKFSGALHIFSSPVQAADIIGPANSVKGMTKAVFSTFTPGMENEFTRVSGISNEVKTASHLYEDAAAFHVNEQIEAMVRPHNILDAAWEGYKNAYRKFAVGWFKVVTNIAQTATYVGAEMKAEENLNARGVPHDSQEAADYKQGFS